jgi:hypothetical protein
MAHKILLMIALMTPATRLTVSPLRLMAGIWPGRSMTPRECASSKQVLPGAAIVFDWPMENGTTCPISPWSIQELTSLVTLWSGYSQRRLTFDASFPGPGAEDKAARQCPETARLAYQVFVQ